MLPHIAGIDSPGSGGGIAEDVSNRTLSGLEDTAAWVPKGRNFSLGEECTEGSLSDFEGFAYTEAPATCLRGRGMPGLQVGFLAKEVHNRAAHLRDTASVLFGEPDHQSRGGSRLEQTVRKSDGHWRAAEITRGTYACSLPEHEGHTQGINGAHGIPRHVLSKEHCMGRLAP